MKRLLILALLVTACGGTVVSVPDATSPLGLVTGSASPTVEAAATTAPTPTPNPEVVRKAAATAYQAAAKAYNVAVKALDKRCKTFATLARARACYKAWAKLEGQFIAKVKVLVVPSDTAGDLHILVIKAAALQAVQIEASKATSWAAFNDAAAAVRKADRVATGAANVVRVDLGLPPVGS